MQSMTFDEPPSYAAWRHRDSREGFEVVLLRSEGTGHHLEGSTAAVEGDSAWTIGYAIDLDLSWSTRSARIGGRSNAGAHDLTLETDGAGSWRIDGVEASSIDGCLDVDLESSALTNAFPVHRLRLEVGESAEAPAAYVRAPDLRVERLQQRYVRLEDAGARQRYLYTAPAFEFEAELTYDEFGLVVEYPGIAVRAA